jgi:hypothetical protein
MQALGVFGEYYYQINDDMKLTVGARWADETKDRDTIDASYFTAVDYAGAPYSSAAFNVGDALRSGADAIATGQAFLIDAALHSSVVNFALLESTTAAIKTNLSSGNANASAYSASGAEAIDREEAKNWCRLRLLPLMLQLRPMSLALIQLLTHMLTNDALRQAGR